MSIPEVSVVIPVYNAERYLESAIASVQAQTFSNFEIIAVDDGSTDGSKAILERLAAADPRLRVVSRPNTGLVGALNDGLAAARGEFIARMDADDWSFPTRFAKQLAYLASRPECVCVGSTVIFMDSRSRPVELCLRLTESEKVADALLKGDGGALIHPSVLIRKAALDQVNGYRKSAEFIEDLDLYLRLAQLGSLANLGEPLLYYRVHTASYNFTKNHKRFPVWQRVLAEAHAVRGLEFTPTPPEKVNDFAASIGSFHQRWAVTSMVFGRRGVAVRHGLLACWRAPREAASWKALAYALRAPLPARSKSLPAVE